MSPQWIYTFVYLAWLVGASCFVLGLHQMNSPATARNGNRLSASGMTIAVAATLVWLITQGGKVVQPATAKLLAPTQPAGGPTA